MSRPAFKDTNQFDFARDKHHQGPLLAAHQEAIQEETPGEFTQRHAVGADLDHDGNIDSYEIADRHHDGSSQRSAYFKAADGTMTSRTASMDSNGKVTSMSEVQYDSEGEVRLARYDTDGDGTIDQEQRDTDGDGTLDNLPIQPGAGEKFSEEAKGAWNIDADGDGDIDWTSSFKADAGSAEHFTSVRSNDENTYDGFDSGEMNAQGARHFSTISPEGNGDSSLMLEQRFDAQGNRTSQTQILNSKDGDDLKSETWQDDNGDGKIESVRTDYYEDPRTSEPQGVAEALEPAASALFTSEETDEQTDEETDEENSFEPDEYSEEYSEESFEAEGETED